MSAEQSQNVNAMFGIDLGSGFVPGGVDTSVSHGRLQEGDNDVIAFCLDPRAASIAKHAINITRPEIWTDLRDMHISPMITPDSVVRPGHGVIHLNEEDDELQHEDAHNGQTEEFYTARLHHGGVLFTALDAFRQMETSDIATRFDKSLAVTYKAQMLRLAAQLIHPDNVPEGFPSVFGNIPSQVWRCPRVVEFFKKYNVLDIDTEERLVARPKARPTAPLGATIMVNGKTKKL